MESAAIKSYEIFKKHFSAEEAETIMAWKDESLSRWVASKEDLNTLETSLKKDISAIREDMYKLETRMIKWFVGTSIALTGVFSGVVFALLKLVRQHHAFKLDGDTALLTSKKNS